MTMGEAAKALVSIGLVGATTNTLSAVLPASAPLKLVIVAPAAVVVVLALLLRLPVVAPVATVAVKGKVMLPPGGMTKLPQTGVVALAAGIVVLDLSVPPASTMVPVAA